MAVRYLQINSSLVVASNKWIDKLCHFVIVDISRCRRPVLVEMQAAAAEAELHRGANAEARRGEL